MGRRKIKLSVWGEAVQVRDADTLSPKSLPRRRKYARRRGLTQRAPDALPYGEMFNPYDLNHIRRLMNLSSGAGNANRWLDLENHMGLFWKAPIHKTVTLLDESGKRELFWYGVTIGQIGFGILASEKRQPTQRAVDLLPCGHTKSASWDDHRGVCVACEVTAIR